MYFTSNKLHKNRTEKGQTKFHIIVYAFPYWSSAMYIFASKSDVYSMLLQTVIDDDTVDAMLSQLATIALSNQTTENLATLVQLFVQFGDLATNGNVTINVEV